MSEPLRLYHFTCDHGLSGIGRVGELRPMVEHPWLHCKVVWLTTEKRPDRFATGLTSNLLDCDRMAHRYVVRDLSRCRPWLTSPERAGARQDFVAELEQFGDPEHWWIASEPVEARIG